MQKQLSNLRIESKSSSDSNISVKESFIANLTPGQIIEGTVTSEEKGVFTFKTSKGINLKAITSVPVKPGTKIKVQILQKDHPLKVRLLEKEDLPKGLGTRLIQQSGKNLSRLKTYVLAKKIRFKGDPSNKKPIVYSSKEKIPEDSLKNKVNVSNQPEQLENSKNIPKLKAKLPTPLKIFSLSSKPTKEGIQKAAILNTKQTLAVINSVLGKKSQQSNKISPQNLAKNSDSRSTEGLSPDIKGGFEALKRSSSQHGEKIFARESVPETGNKTNVTTENIGSINRDKPSHFKPENILSGANTKSKNFRDESINESLSSDNYSKEEFGKNELNVHRRNFPSRTNFAVNDRSEYLHKNKEKNIDKANKNQLGQKKTDTSISYQPKGGSFSLEETNNETLYSKSLNKATISKNEIQNSHQLKSHKFNLQKEDSNSNQITKTTKNTIERQSNNQEINFKTFSTKTEEKIKLTSSEISKHKENISFSKNELQPKSNTRLNKETLQKIQNEIKINVRTNEHLKTASDAVLERNNNSQELSDEKIINDSSNKINFTTNDKKNIKQEQPQFIESKKQEIILNQDKKDLEQKNSEYLSSSNKKLIFKPSLKNELISYKNNDFKPHQKTAIKEERIHESVKLNLDTNAEIQSKSQNNSTIKSKSLNYSIKSYSLRANNISSGPENEKITNVAQGTDTSSDPHKTSSVKEHNLFFRDFVKQLELTQQLQSHFHEKGLELLIIPFFFENIEGVGQWIYWQEDGREQSSSREIIDHLIFDLAMENLGELNIHLFKQQNEIFINIHANSDKIPLIKENLSKLSDSIKGLGFKIGGIEVFSMDEVNDNGLCSIAMEEEGSGNVHIIT